jgi:gentisate 1,2-dioxygenase
MPGENAPEHRHTQHAFRFVVEGEGVWTVVGRDPVPMRRGDFLPQAGWNWHAHHNATDQPMAWIDGLDIPFQYETESQFFEFGRDEISDAERTTPERSRSQKHRERHCSHTDGSTPTKRCPTSSNSKDSVSTES